MQVMSPKLTLLRCNRGVSNILIGSRLHFSTVKIREGFYFEMPRISTAAFAGDPTNIAPVSSVENENISYSSRAIEQHTKASEDETTTTEKLFNCEEMESAAASADVMGFAEEALKAVSNSTDLVGESKNFGDIRSEENLVICEQSRLTEKEKPEVVKALDPFRSQAIEEESNSNVACPPDFPPVLVSKHMAKATIRSQKRAERRARRVKGGVKNIKLPYPKQSWSRKESWKSKWLLMFHLVKLLDGEHVVRDTINSERLSATEEIELSKRIQDQIKLRRVRFRLLCENGVEPTLDRWARAAGTDTRTLQRRLLVGKYCREKLFRSYMGLVGFIAKIYMDLGICYKELFQIGCCGLVKGIAGFNYRKGFRFSTYAGWWIRARITMTLCYSSDIVRFPPPFYFNMHRVKRTETHFLQLHGRFPTVEELATITGLSDESLILAKRYNRKRRKFKDIDADPSAEGVENIFIKQELKREIAKSFTIITRREREILRLRFGFDDGRQKPRSEIGELCNYSNSRVRQIEEEALRKIRERSPSLTHYLYSHS